MGLKEGNSVIRSSIWSQTSRSWGTGYPISLLATYAACASVQSITCERMARLVTSSYTKKGCDAYSKTWTSLILYEWVATSARCWWSYLISSRDFCLSSKGATRSALQRARAKVIISIATKNSTLFSRIREAKVQRRSSKMLKEFSIAILRRLLTMKCR